MLRRRLDKREVTSKEALPKLAARKPGDPNPLIVGKESVQRYMTLVGECAKAGALKAK